MTRRLKMTQMLRQSNYSTIAPSMPHMQSMNRCPKLGNNLPNNMSTPPCSSIGFVSLCFMLSQTSALLNLLVLRRLLV
ncbi:hypothetical protein RchiOBHm_Chr3g0496301 [Rosa chinensis]|uniref:Uncharacterized protein n=1 Tax=Rosa chinensis TaxID=74649 RepID=A0A2P6RHG5_ROSCH|nr:hypothetical protein RchiOBHm_Chr3g0496301 [Rosa chinensis]